MVQPLDNAKIKVMRLRGSNAKEDSPKTASVFPGQREQSDETSRPNRRVSERVCETTRRQTTPEATSGGQLLFLNIIIIVYI